MVLDLQRNILTSPELPEGVTARDVKVILDGTYMEDAFAIDTDKRLIRCYMRDEENPAHDSGCPGFQCKPKSSFVCPACNTVFEDDGAADELDVVDYYYSGHVLLIWTSADGRTGVIDCG